MACKSVGVLGCLQRCVGVKHDLVGTCAHLCVFLFAWRQYCSWICQKKPVFLLANHILSVNESHGVNKVLPKHTAAMILLTVCTAETWRSFPPDHCNLTRLHLCSKILPSDKNDYKQKNSLSWCKSLKNVKENCSPPHKIPKNTKKELDVKSVLLHFCCIKFVGAENFNSLRISPRTLYTNPGKHGR